MFRNLLAITAVAALPLVGCGVFESADKAAAVVRIPKPNVAAASFARAAAEPAREWYRVSVTGAGMAPVAVTGEVDGAAVRLTELEPGAPRYFTAELFSDGALNRKTYAGVSAAITLVAGETANVTIDVRSVKGNRPPALTTAAIAAGTYDTDSEITCTPEGFSDPEGDAPQYRFAWLVNGEVGGAAEATLTGEAFDKGDTVRCRVTPFDGLAEGKPVESNEVTIVNSAPKVTVSFANGPYFKTSALTPTVSPVDADGDTLTLTYAWTIGTEAQMVTSATFAAGSAIRGQTVTVTVTASDGAAFSAAVSAAVVIQNSPPALLSAALSVTNPATNDAISVTAGNAYDADGDAVGVSFQWYKNGLPIVGQTAATLNGNYFDRGDAVYALATPNDGTDDGLAVSSDTAVVVNSPPVVAAVDISYTSLRETSVFTAWFQGKADPDGDVVSGPVDWYVNGIVVATQDSLDGNYFSKGDTVWFTYTPFDGTAYGAMATSTSVVVQNTPPVLTTAAFVSLPYYTDSTASIDAAYSDADGDAASFVVEWSAAGSPVPGESQLLLSGAYFNRGDALVAWVRAYDGQAFSDYLTLDTIIQNSPPIPGSYTLTPLEVPSGLTPFVIQADAQPYDADGDALIYMVDWYKNGVYSSSDSSLGFTVATLPGEQWNAQVAVYDGEEWSNPVQTSNTVVIAKTAQQVDVGRSMACAVTVNNDLECWGDGYLGRGSYESQSAPVAITAFAGDVSSVSVGYLNACAVKTDNTLWCWGWNSYGEAGQGTTYSPVASPTQVAALSVTQVSVGRDHVCAVATDHSLYCWGQASFDQLGLGSATSYATPQLVSLASVAQVSAGSARTCAVNLSGDVYCWGQDPMPSAGGTQTLPAQVNLGETAVQVSVGATHTCALTSTPSVRCWGENESGQLGDGTAARSATPASVSVGQGTPIAVAAGNQFSCVAMTGAVKCWGANKAGSLGDGTGSSSFTPTTVALGPLSGTPAQVDAGEEAACTTIDDGAAYCWGFNRGGVLGRGVDLKLVNPVSSDQYVEALAANNATLCTLWAGDTWCWGKNNAGQFGAGGMANEVWEPQMASGGTSSAAAVSLGNDHLCTLRADQSVWCSGKSLDGQAASPNLGMYQLTATPVIGLAATAISMGYDHSCAVRTDGKVACWGKNDRGQLGDGSVGTSVTMPVEVTGVTNAVALSAGTYHTCAVTGTGALYCWGGNTYGALGNGDNVDQPVPVQVMASGAQLVEASDEFTCAIKTDATVWCWGRNQWGNLGDGSYGVNASTPQQVAGAFMAQALSSAGPFVCAIDLSNDVYCWGNNANGELGQNVGAYSATPVGPVVSGVDLLAAATQSACAFEALSPPFGTLHCWGHNEIGQLFDPATRSPDVVSEYWASSSL